MIPDDNLETLLEQQSLLLKRLDVVTGTIKDGVSGVGELSASGLLRGALEEVNQRIDNIEQSGGVPENDYPHHNAARDDEAETDSVNPRFGDSFLKFRTMMNNALVSDILHDDAFRTRLGRVFYLLELWYDEGMGSHHPADVMDYVELIHPVDGTSLPALTMFHYANIALLHHQKAAMSQFVHWHQLPGGGLLGDEMGTGKTVTVMSFLGALMLSGCFPQMIDSIPVTLSYTDDEVQLLLADTEYFESTSRDMEIFERASNKFDCVREQLMLYVGNGSETLKVIPKMRDEGGIVIVVPASLEGHWVKECYLWCPLIQVVLYRDVIKSRLSDEWKKNMRSTSITIVGYESLTRNKSDFVNYKWGYIIADEGHRIKNGKTDVSRSLKLLETSHMKNYVRGSLTFRSGGHRILLSGTPIQNNLEEFWSLIDFIRPGLLGTLESFQMMMNPIISIMQKHQIKTQSGGGVGRLDREVLVADHCIRQLKNMTNECILRRTKVDIGIVEEAASTGGFDEVVLFCPISWSQFEV
eukprot:GHVH01007908.1.p2 GENE.GHVH01007908.1~~GHVH01007908.1.p2  ORF type:complete len:526 (+),score=94.27 GHVH01007908.1:2146-3723(+)